MSSCHLPVSVPTPQGYRHVPQHQAFYVYAGDAWGASILSTELSSQLTESQFESTNLLQALAELLLLLFLPTYVETGQYVAEDLKLPVLLTLPSELQNYRAQRKRYKNQRGGGYHNNTAHRIN